MPLIVTSPPSSFSSSLRKNEGHPSRLEGKFEGKVRILRESLREYLGAISKFEAKMAPTFSPSTWNFHSLSLIPSICNNLEWYMPYSPLTI